MSTGLGHAECERRLFERMPARLRWEDWGFAGVGNWGNGYGCLRYARDAPKEYEDTDVINPSR